MAGVCIFLMSRTSRAVVCWSKSLFRKCPSRSFAQVMPREPGDLPEGTGWNDFGSVEQYERKWIKFFERSDMDCFELSRGLNHAFHFDIIPTIPVLEAAIKAARRINEPIIACRVFHALREKCKSDQQYVEYSKHLSELKDQLGIKAPEEIGRF